ncbi:MAG: polysaccharide deacetylase family protein [Marinibacterium sp.]|nr:polysaccharide deacetylase family protein [Marinibacterium sp.]
MTRLDLAPLRDELAIWRDTGQTLPVWWRDDDAVAPTPALDQLSRLSARYDLPVHLAVIPEPSTRALGSWLRDAPHMVAVQHGFAHRSHAPLTEKKAEFGAHRPRGAMLDDITQGQALLRDRLGLPIAPIFVPPWNRITPDLSPGLAQAGFRALSTFAPRTRPEAAPGLAQINTHLDPIDWKGSRDLADPARLTAQIVAQLQDRRAGRTDPREPYGLLTHHLVHTSRIWDWTDALLDTLMSGPVTRWSAPTP